MFKNLLYGVLFVLTLAGCENKTEEATQVPKDNPDKVELVATQASAFLTESTEAVVVETPAEALPTWRKHSLSKPALLLMAKNPLLQTIPEEMRDQVKALVSTGDVKDFSQQALATAVSPVMLPNMALSAALDSDLFSRVIWVLPTLPGTSVTLDAFRQQLLALKDVTQAEADSFTGDDVSFSGVIRGVPFTVVLKSTFPEITEPVILHLDLGFLSADYQDEIKTPLYKHVDNSLAGLKEQGLKVFAATICVSNLTGEASLRTRFLGPHIRSLITDPTLLGEKLTGNTALRNEALYVGSFFKKEEVLELNRRMVEADPEDASAQYDAYRTFRQFNEIDASLKHLERAANTDRVYAMEYLELADVALEKNRPDGALRMLQKATTYFPDNPFLEISQADILIRMGHAEQPKTMLEKLIGLPWSTTYHGNMPGYLDEMLAAAEMIETSEENGKAEK
jgi:hypothetical protein